MTVVHVAIGVDIGTSTVKAAALDDSGLLRGSAQRATRWASTTDQRNQITAGTILDDVLRTIAEAITAVAGDRDTVSVRALGLAGLGESGFLLDRHGAPIGPAFAWFDSRGVHQMAALGSELAEQFTARTGLPVSPQCTVAKLLWMRDQGIQAGPGSCWLNVPEYVAHALGAARTTEPSLASRTGLLDQATGTTWSEMVHEAGMTTDMIPATVLAGHPTGVVTSDDAPRQLRGAVVTIAGHDHSVAAIGAGAVEDEQLFNSFGTADVLLRSVSGTLSDADRRDLVAHGVDAGRHNLPGRSALLTGTRGGLLLQRTLQLLDATDPVARDALDRSVPAGRAGTPSATVTVDTADDGSLRVDAADGASRADIWQAALATVTAEAARCTRAINRVVGPHWTASAAGGWTAMRSVRAARRHAIPDITFSRMPEPGAVGAALFAAYAAQSAPGDFLAFARALLPQRSTARTEATPALDRETING